MAQSLELVESSKTHSMLLPQPGSTSPAARRSPLRLEGFPTRLPVNDLAIPGELTRQLTAFGSDQMAQHPKAGRRIDDLGAVSLHIRAPFAAWKTAVVIAKRHREPVRQKGPVFAILCAYENNNFPIKRFDETLAVPLCFAAHFTRARLFCAFAAGPSATGEGLPSDGCTAHCASRRANRADQKSERRACNHQTCAASGQQQSVKLLTISAKAVGVGAASQGRIAKGERSELQSLMSPMGTASIA